MSAERVSLPVNTVPEFSQQALDSDINETKVVSTTTTFEGFNKVNAIFSGTGPTEMSGLQMYMDKLYIRGVAQFKRQSWEELYGNTLRIAVVLEKVVDENTLPVNPPIFEDVFANENNTGAFVADIFAYQNLRNQDKYTVLLDELISPAVQNPNYDGALNIKDYWQVPFSYEIDLKGIPCIYDHNIDHIRENVLYVCYRADREAIGTHVVIEHAYSRLIYRVRKPLQHQQWRMEE